ncbi:MAG: hypothetical protein HC851_15195 [Acaryochloris sp. RU_4_1]|nr:hypothetical protein [Acaryochloris sp. RU_4_1]NJR56757.1 hypothetical protein [Acaryochloris sp. CRU_2_0]
MKSFTHRIIKAIKSFRPDRTSKQQCSSCGEWYTLSQLDRDGVCWECQRFGA